MVDKRKLIIALDAMGGDYAPEAVLEGAAKALAEHRILSSSINIEYIIYGNERVLAPLMRRFTGLDLCSTIVHSEQKIQSDDKPSYAVRNSKDTSMGMAIAAVKQQRAHAVVSSGNTGALMAIAKLALRTLPGIHRPAIIGLLPTDAGKVVALDLGANAECESENLVQFSIMGDAFAKVMLGQKKPKIGLLNIGSEEIKGNEVIKSTAQILYNQKCLNFVGYVEANDITRGVVDVVVADGFSGNVAIKMAEGVGQLCKTLMEKAFRSSILAKLGYLLAKKSLKTTFKQIDGRYYNGAMLIGLNGIVVKSHGGADAVAFANAILTAVELCTQNINARIIQEIDAVQQELARNSESLSI